MSCSDVAGVLHVGKKQKKFTPLANRFVREQNDVCVSCTGLLSLKLGQHTCNSEDDSLQNSNLVYDAAARASC